VTGDSDTRPLRRQLQPVGAVRAHRVREPGGGCRVGGHGDRLPWGVGAVKEGASGQRAAGWGVGASGTLVTQVTMLAEQFTLQPSP
jgi:hypothetical protein